MGCFFLGGGGGDVVGLGCKIDPLLQNVLLDMQGRRGGGGGGGDSGLH